MSEYAAIGKAQKVSRIAMPAIHAMHWGLRKKGNKYSALKTKERKKSQNLNIRYSHFVRTPHRSKATSKSMSTSPPSKCIKVSPKHWEIKDLGAFNTKLSTTYRECCVAFKGLTALYLKDTSYSRGTNCWAIASNLLFLMANVALTNW